ncbi:L,D-transpeptidase [Parabacteroides sp. OttesenSCG-928-G07]|nr:L,D-transpeptidase [Parabacteroides sp. OttesenSCG-928-G21]MDL2278342.1 L,D-transpeptidase [Parabacteroides sp. OttesenSCG-928-G07]
MKYSSLFFFGMLFFSFCTPHVNSDSEKDSILQDSMVQHEIEAAKPLVEIKIRKELLYDSYTLEDEYPYQDTVRSFQWDKIHDALFFIDSVQLEPTTWAVLQNYKNRNREAPLVKEFTRNEYKRVTDAFGVERYQSVPLFLTTDTITGERYGRDGTPVKLLGETGGFYHVKTLNFDGDWLVPKRYVKVLGDTVAYNHVVVVDRKNQNITTLEKVGKEWLVRSMNPATTGVHSPPYAKPTPLGLFVIQEQKPKMIYLKDGSTETGGFAPWASRFSNGGYIHGVPVNAPGTSLVEYSATLGTIPRSHMCVRNVTSHAKFIYDWAPVEASFVYVLE